MTFLCVPLKLSTEVDVVTPLRRFIAGKFGEAVASQCAKSLDKLSELRYEACFGEPKDLNRRMEAFALLYLNNLNNTPNSHIIIYGKILQ
ncbi:hypothetical protein EWB00_010423 [Schistosoma japonicum]|uniref:Uncharacterized protein n=1 Tax=Schistosoma japonicum TaxID=6182 RepID=A0A4Z2DYJ8_SCHJA|nr:hypothetical protein EWB00_010423 [Schistosoma japonicum]